MLLLNPLSSEKEKQFFNKISGNIPIDILLSLKQVLGDDLYFVISILAGRRVNIPDIDELARIYNEIKGK